MLVFKNILSRWWREITIAVSVLIIATLILRPKPQAEIKTVVKVEEKIVTKVETQVKYRDRWREKVRETRKPDGTTVVERDTTIQRDESVTQTQSKEAERRTEESQSVVVYPPRPNYFLGVSTDIGRTSISTSMGVRVADSSFFLLGGAVVNIKNPIAIPVLNVGIGVEF